MGKITTVIGGGSSYTYPTTGVSATSVGVTPYGITIVNNNLYLVSMYMVLKVPAGPIVGGVGVGTTIYPFAGSSWNNYGGAGDGGLATNAQFAQPLDIVADGNGNVYISDSYDGRIRVVNSTGYINTVAGGGSSVYNDGLDPRQINFNAGIEGMGIDKCGNVFVASHNPSVIMEIFFNNIGNISHYKYNSTSGLTLDNVKNVSVNITGDAVQSIISQGDYFWSPATGSGNYTITPYKNNDVTKSNGVTALDIALIQSHILQKNLFNDAYKCFAADINNDGNVSTLDIVYMKRLILGMDTTFKDKNTNQYKLWSFIDTKKNFSDPTNPFKSCTNCSTPNSYNESFSQNISATCTTSIINFYGLKLGDVNWDWNPAMARQAPITLYFDNLNITDVPVEENIVVPIKVKNFNNIVGTQYTLDFDPMNLQLLSVDKTDDNLDFNDSLKGQGKISFVWNDPTVNGTHLEDGTVLYNLIFRKKRQVRSQDIVLTSDITPVEAVNVDFELVPIEKKICRIYDNSNGAIDDFKESWEIIPPYSMKGNLFIKANVADNKQVTINVMNNKFETIFSTVRNLQQGQNTIYSNLRSVLNIDQGIYYVNIDGIEPNDTKAFFVGKLDDLATADEIAQGTAIVNSNNADLTKYVLKAQLYSDIKVREELLADPILQLFEEQNASSNFDKIYKIDAALSVGDFDKAQDLINNFEIQNDVDVHYKQYYNLILSVTHEGLNADQIDAANLLSLDCPITGGMVVYSARDLYNSVIEDNLAFENVCPLTVAGKQTKPMKIVPAKPTISNHYEVSSKIYPNPTHGVVTIELPKNMNGSWNVIVTDMLGKTIQEKKAFASEGMISLNIEGSTGMYFVKIMNTVTGYQEVKKVVKE